MTRYARVDDLDSIQTFKIALVKFHETCTVALADAESEVIRTLHWLEGEQPAYWQSVIKKRTFTVERCTQALSAKKMYPDATGRPQSTFDEEKALRIAKMQLEEAVQKLAATKRCATLMKKEIETYKGGVQRFASSVQSDVPAAIAHLGNLLATLKEYVATNPTAVASTAAQPTTSSAATDASVQSMARQPTEESMTPKEQQEQQEKQ
jgi:hypothetical protein